jgi:hypothetical protein
MRQSFDDYNETCKMIDVLAAIHLNHLGLLMPRGISSTGHFRQAKKSVINAFDTNCLMPADEVMASILQLALNMEEELPGTDLTAQTSPTPPIIAFVAAARGSQCGRGHNGRGGRGDRGLPNKCNACGSLDHIMSSCAASDDAVLKWTRAKRKMIVHKYSNRRPPAAQRRPPRRGVRSQARRHLPLPPRGGRL